MICPTYIEALRSALSALDTQISSYLCKPIGLVVVFGKVSLGEDSSRILPVRLFLRYDCQGCPLET